MITEKQKEYIEYLAEQTYTPIDIDDMDNITKQEASKVISELLEIQKQMGGKARE